MSTPLPPALVLTAGFGTRLAPLTDLRAKPAVPVAGKSFIFRLLQWLSAQGVSSAVLNLHHRPDTITRCIGHGTNVGLAVRYSWEPTILGTAGGPRRALPLLGNRFFVINGDTLTGVDLHAITKEHNTRGAQVTLAVTTNPNPDRYGGVVVNNRGYVQGFVRPGQHTHSHFLGVQLVEASVFGCVSETLPTASIGGLYDTLISKQSNAVYAHPVSASFFDVGTPRDYMATSLAIAKADGLTSLPLGKGSKVDVSASVIRTAIWDDVIIEAGCRVSDCVITDGVRLPKNTHCERQVITVSENCLLPSRRPLGDLWLYPLDP